jgi:hypothetical protein
MLILFFGAFYSLAGTNSARLKLNHHVVESAVYERQTLNINQSLPFGNKFIYLLFHGFGSLPMS